MHCRWDSQIRVTLWIKQRVVVVEEKCKTTSVKCRKSEGSRLTRGEREIIENIFFCTTSKSNNVACGAPSFRVIS